MTYIRPNIRTKKALKEAIANGDEVYAFEPGLGKPPASQKCYIEMPWYPEPHRSYAQVLTDENCKVIKFLG